MTQHHYTLFIDEAGDDKVSRLKPEHANGNSEWLCLGGYLIRSEFEDDMPRRRDELLLEIGGKRGGILHYKNLKPKNRFKVTKLLATANNPARAFVVCSYKKTMLGYRNPRAEASVSHQRDFLFNFVLRLLIERVTDYIAMSSKKHGVVDPVLKIVVASRRGHHFGRLVAYLDQLIRQSIAGTTYLSTRTVNGKMLRRSLISRQTASNDAGLQLADVIVSSFYQSIEQSNKNYGDKPSLNLLPLMAKNRRSHSAQPKYKNEGVTLFPDKQVGAMLTKEQRSFFERFGYDFLLVQNPYSPRKKGYFTQSQRMWSNEFKN